MLINAYIYEFKVFVVIFVSMGATWNIIFFKNRLIKFAEIFDSQKMTKKTKSPFLGGILIRFFELLEKFHNRKCLGL